MSCKTKKTNENDSIVVETATAKMISTTQYLAVSGVIKSIQSVDIVSDTPGRIIKILFKSGQFVHKNDLLIVLDHEAEAANLAGAQAKLIYLQKNFTRYRSLEKREVITKDNLDNLQSQLDQTKADTKRLRAELDKKYIRAPFSGVLGIKQVSLGQAIQPSDKIIALERKDAMILDLTIPEQYIKYVHIGKSIKIKSNLYGTIVALDSSINYATHSLAVRVLIKNNHLDAIAGEFVTIQFPLFTSNVITIPLTAISYDINGVSAYVVKDHIAHLKTVEADLHDNYAVIKKGILRNEIVVSAGQAKLFDGAKVKVSG